MFYYVKKLFLGSQIIFGHDASFIRAITQRIKMRISPSYTYSVQNSAYTYPVYTEQPRTQPELANSE